MKKSLIILGALAGLAIVGSVCASRVSTFSVRSFEVKAESSEDVSTTRLYAEDQIAFTWYASEDNFANLKIHIWNVTFVDESGYSAVRDMSAVDNYIGNINVTDGAFDAIMTWAGQDDLGRRHYEWTAPWYIKSFTYKYFNTAGQYVYDERSASRGNEYYDYIWDTYAHAQVSHEVNDSSYVSSFKQYTVTYSDGGANIGSESVYEDTKLTPSDITTGGKVYQDWYSNVGLSSAFSDGTKITSDITLYGDFVVTAESFSNYVMSFESGDIVTAECATKYAAAKALYDEMSNAEKTTLESSYAEAYARYSHWVYVNESASSAAVVNETENSAAGATTLSVVCAAGVVAAGAFVFVRKRRLL